MADDFCPDEGAGVAYLTVRQHNTIEQMPLRAGGSARQIVAGEPSRKQLVGPSSAACGRRPNDYGRMAWRWWLLSGVCQGERGERIGGVFRGVAHDGDPYGCAPAAARAGRPIRSA
jgi:hypothetical protein